jgi:hypothetical protein
MSIPYWREVQYTDDGCSVYQCLNCYSKWESRTAPWWSKDGKKPEKEGIWNRCPVCGCRWVGQIIPKEKLYHRYYPRYGTGNGRLYPCKFKIVSVYKDGEYVGKDTEHRGIEDPAWAVKKLKEHLKWIEEPKVKGLFNSITYHIEKDIA